MSDQPTIYAALSAVMDGVQAVKKGDRNTQQNLLYRRLPFWHRVDVQTTTDACWPWIGAINSATGYGTLSHGYAHRRAYELVVGPIPEGLTIDHLCGVKVCCNPLHLEAVTRGENARRGNARRLTKSGGRPDLLARTACKNGHAWTADSHWIGQRGERRCRACQRARSAAFRERAGVSHA